MSADDIFPADVALEDFAHRGDSIGHRAVRDAEFALKLTLRCAVEHSAEDFCQLRRLLFELPQKFAEEQAGQRGSLFVHGLFVFLEPTVINEAVKRELSLLFYLINTHADSLFRTVMSTLATDNTFLILLNVAAAGHFFLDGFKGFFRNDCIMMVLNLKPLSLPLINDALLLWVRAALDLTIQDQIQARPDGRAYKA